MQPSRHHQLLDDRSAKKRISRSRSAGKLHNDRCVGAHEDACEASRREQKDDAAHMLFGRSRMQTGAKTEAKMCAGSTHTCVVNLSPSRQSSRRSKVPVKGN
jgi:hypothetical protein